MQNGKKSTNSLAIILKNYPYIKGETFFHPELEILSRSFKQIVVVSRQADCSNQNVHYVLPKNVIHINLDVKLTFSSRIIFFIKSVFNGTWIRLIQDLVNSTAFNPLTIKTAIAYDEMAMMTKDKLEVAMKSRGLAPMEFLWYSYWCDDSAYMLSRWKATGGIKYAISRAHGFDLYNERHPFNYLPFRKYIYVHLDKVICISDHGKHFLCNKFPDFRDKFEVFSLGVENQSEIESLPRNPIRIVSISTIIPLKNIKLLIQALEFWELTELEWHHYGQGAGDAYQDSVLEMATNLLSKNGKISFQFHGFIPPEHVIQQLKELQPHVLVNSSTFEGIPVSMMEASSLGIPIIGPRIFGIPEIIKDGINGFSFFPLTAQSLEIALLKLANLSDSDYEEMRKNARTLQQENFNAKLNHLKFASHIQTTLNPDKKV